MEVSEVNNDLVEKFMSTNKSKVCFCEYRSLVDTLKQNEGGDLFFLVDSELTRFSQYSDFLNYVNEHNDRFLYITGGESCKTISCYEQVIEKILSKKLTRSSRLIVVGGGSVSDLGGFIAATILRGISWSVVPTTLLSLVDAAIGGKVAINSSIGKNQIGSFHFPSNIYISTQFTSTLKHHDWESGIGELIKYTFLDNDMYFMFKNESIDLSFRNRNFEIIDKLIKLAVNKKVSIVNCDPFEKGIRKSLNLGHTFGHAFEKVFMIPHGIAVLWGILLLSKFFRRADIERNLIELADKCSFPFYKDKILLECFSNMNIDLVMDALLLDKKKSSSQHLEFVIPVFETNESYCGNIDCVSIKIDECKKFLLMFKDMCMRE